LYLSIQQAEKSLFRMGLIAAVVGFVNIVSLFLSWYVHTVGNLQSEPIMGYMRVETLALSLLGGAIASTGTLSSWIAKRLERIKRAESSLVLVGGIIAILSPVVMVINVVPGLEEAGGGGYFDVGLFISAFSAATVVVIGVFILLIPVNVETVPSTAAPAPTWPTETVPPFQLPPLSEAPPVQRRTEARIVVMDPVEELVEGAMCTICYQSLQLESTVRCSACGALYHQGCIDVWVDLNGTCPNCKNPVGATYPRETS